MCKGHLNPIPIESSLQAEYAAAQERWIQTGVHLAQCFAATRTSKFVTTVASPIAAPMMPVKSVWRGFGWRPGTGSGWIFLKIRSSRENEDEILQVAG